MRHYSRDNVKILSGAVTRYAKDDITCLSCAVTHFSKEDIKFLSGCAVTHCSGSEPHGRMTQVTYVTKNILYSGLPTSSREQFFSCIYTGTISSFSKLCLFAVHVCIN